MKDKTKPVIRKTFEADRWLQFQVDGFFDRHGKAGSAMFFQIINGKVKGMILPVKESERLADLLREVKGRCGVVNADDMEAD